MASWSPWKSWWLDVLKFAVTFFLGAVVTITVVDTLQERRAQRMHIAGVAWERDVDALEEFRAASLLYIQAAEDALAQASLGRGSSENNIVRRWREDAHNRILLSLETVGDRFRHHSNVASALQEFEDTMNQLHREFLELRNSTGVQNGYRHSDTFNQLKELRRTAARLLEYAISDPTQR